MVFPIEGRKTIVNTVKMEMFARVLF